jgi:hypothetical protein
VGVLENVEGIAGSCLAEVADAIAVELREATTETLRVDTRYDPC